MRVKAQSVNSEILLLQLLKREILNDKGKPSWWKEEFVGRREKRKHSQMQAAALGVLR